jgi:hypothetical protein
MTPELDLQRIPEFCRLPKFVALQVHGFESLRIRDFEASQVQDSRLSRVRDPETSQVQDSRPPRVCDSETSRVHDSRPPRVRDSETLRVHDSRPPRVCDSETSWVQDSRSSRVLCSWKLISQIWLTSTFRGWQVFLNFPTQCIFVLEVCPCMFRTWEWQPSWTTKIAGASVPDLFFSYTQLSWPTSWPPLLVLATQNWQKPTGHTRFAKRSDRVVSVVGLAIDRLAV